MKSLIITEKPIVAMNICAALEIKDSGKNKGYIEDDSYVVSWCFGHLVELAKPVAYGEQYKKWSYGDLPIIPEDWKYEVREDTEEQFEVLKTLLNREDVNEVWNCCDAGREGEAILRLVYEMAGCSKPIKRLWISSMEAEAIRDGVEKLKPGSEFDSLYNSARCRQEADWLVGINGTRLFSTLYDKTLKVGRVQTPTLAMIVNREREINDFQKVPYYTVHISAPRIDAVSKPTRDKAAAMNLALMCNGKDATVKSVVKEEKSMAAPQLYDLTTLQRDVNRLFGYTAKQTLDYTQSLYEKRLVTYPRTDSKYLSDDMEETARKVLYLVRKEFSFIGESKDVDDIRRILNSKKVTDHHAIIPTLEIASLNKDAVPAAEMNILALVSVRLACAVGEAYRYTTSKYFLSCEDEEFSVTGKTVTKRGWKETDDVFRNSFRVGGKEKATFIPVLTEGQVLEGVESRAVEGFTKAPSHFTEDSLLLAMEKAGAEDMADDVERKGLGTPATRADIIEKLVKDGFLKRDKKLILPTEDGVKLISVLPEELKSVKLTAEWENRLAEIARGEADADSFMGDIRDMVKRMVAENREVSEEKKALFGTRNREVLGKCPRCGSDVVKGKFGAYCTKKCGMILGKAMGKDLSDEQIVKLLNGERILVKDIKSKKGKVFDAFLAAKGISEFPYTDKEGNERTGFKFDYRMEFPE